MTQPFNGTTKTRARESGFLALHKQDFLAHVEGTGFRHNSSSIDVSAIPNLSATTVQEALEELQNIITSSGTGYIAIGRADENDGYTQADFNVGAPETLTLADCFAAALASERLTEGGTILLCSNLFTTSTPITIPPNITIMGEASGTIIVGEMTEQPIFILENGSRTFTQGGDSGGGDIRVTSGSLIEQIRLVNLVLCDNLFDAASSGAGPTMITSGFLQMKTSANVSLERVSFLGRIADGSVTGRSKTLCAIQTISGGGTATSLTVKDCFIDGCKLGIRFTPGNGAVDFLTVTGTKARTYGTENATTDPAQNSFIVSTLCNASITQNYYIGAGSQCKTFYTISSGTGSVFNIVTSNSGSAFDDIGQLIANQSGSAFRSVITANNWGRNIESPWYLVVGGASLTAPMGDIFGTNAINVVLNLSNYRGTVIVNPGTYNVTGGSSNFANLKFIGNKQGSDYPVFELDLSSSSTDTLGNRPLALGNHLESIKFVSINNPHSIRPGFDTASISTQGSPAYSLTVKDCVFVDTCLYALGTPSGPFTDDDGNPAPIEINIENCYFHHNSTFPDNHQLVLPTANMITVSNCFFSGYGYAMSIGTTGYSGSSAFTGAIYKISNVVYNLVGYTITGNGFLAISAYININDTVAKVIFDDCRVVCHASLGQAQPLDAGLITVITGFIILQCRMAIIENCLFNTPSQTFEAASVEYALPGLKIRSLESARIVNNRFMSGSLQLQFTGSGLFASLSGGNEVVIQGNEFISAGGDAGMTLVDIDVDTGALGLRPFINFSNNLVTSVASTNIQVRHENATGSYYTAQGIVQIYANLFSTAISNNKIAGTLLEPSTNPYTHFAALVNNGYDSAAGSGTFATTANICNNTIQVTNEFADGTATHGGEDLYLKVPVLQMSNNYLGMENNATPSSSFIGNLWLDLRPTVSTNFASGMVTGNTFSRRGGNGTASTLVQGYVHLESTSGRGSLVDNTFSDPTINGSSTVVVDDDVSQPSNWLVERNRNQTVSTNVRPWVGTMTVEVVLGFPIIAGGSYPTNLIASVNAEADSPSYALLLVYDGTGTATFDYCIPLQDILPPNVRIVSVVISGTSNTTLTTGTFTWQLQAQGLTSINGDTSLIFSGAYVANDVITSTITPVNTNSTNTFENTADRNLRLFLLTNSITGSSTNIKFTSIAITYRW